MERLVGPQGKRISLHRHFWRCVLFVGLFAPFLVIMLLVHPNRAFATPVASFKNAFSVSPTRGPVGAVVVVNGSGTFFSDGTTVNLGYTLDGRTCNIVAGGQPGTVQNGAFSGWFRWPTSTGTGTFSVCGMANTFAFQMGSYQVLSASVARVAVTPTVPKAGQPATVSGANFLPAGSSVNLYWHSANGGQSVFLGTVTSSATGAFTHTFTVPARSSTGSYSVMGLVGTGSPPTLTATTTFRVSGITIVAVPTPTISLSPTAPPAASATPRPTPRTTSQQPTVTGDGNANLFLSVTLGGVLLIGLALGAGVLVVRRQRHLFASAPPTSGPLLWPEAASTVNRGPNSEPGTLTPWPGMMYPGGHSPLGSPVMEYAPPPGPTVPPATWNRASTIPFDPGLVEAMREAQVSLFATPRPPTSEEVEIP